MDWYVCHRFDFLKTGIAKVGTKCGQFVDRINNTWPVSDGKEM